MNFIKDLVKFSVILIMFKMFVDICTKITLLVCYYFGYFLSKHVPLFALAEGVSEDFVTRLGFSVILALIAGSIILYQFIVIFVDVYSLKREEGRGDCKKV